MPDRADQTSAASVRLVLVDDHEVVRRGLVSLLGSAPDVVVVGEASTAEAGLHLVATERPDVALIDVVLPGRDGIAVCRQIRSHQPDVGCLLLTAHDEDEARLATVLAGAAGYLTKDLPGSAMLDAVRRVAAGQALLDTTAASTVLGALQAPPAGGPGGHSHAPALTAAEHTLLDLVAGRCSNAEIARRLGVPERTVETRLAVVFAKIGLERRISADVHGRRMVYRSELDPPVAAAP